MGLYETIQPLAEGIISQSKNILENIENGSLEQDLVSKAKSLATSCLSIASSIAQYIDQLPEDSLYKTQFQVSFVQEYEENLRGSIINMVNCSKLLFSSRLSYTNNINLSNSLKEVVNNSKMLIEASKSMPANSFLHFILILIILKISMK